MKVFQTPIENIACYDSNPRNNDHTVEPLCQSIRQFGFTQPIVIDEDGIIVAGHTRWKAAKKLGLKKVPTVNISTLTKDEVKAYRILDNRLGEIADWDCEILEKELSSIDFDFEPFDVGFDFIPVACDISQFVAGKEVEKVSEKTAKKDIFVVFDSKEKRDEVSKELTKRGFRCHRTTIKL